MSRRPKGSGAKLPAVKSFETDVLVVGGGGAATATTINAHDNGAKTMLAVKGQFGVPGKRGAGATSNPLAEFWTIRTVGKKGGWFNPPELVYEDMLQIALGTADPKLCRIFVEEVSDALKRLQSMGMRFQSKMLATMPATEESKGTNNIVLVQKAVIAGTNTEVVEQANLTNILVEDGEVVGAVGVDDAGEPFIVHAKAVVLATGGVGQLFQYSFNPPGNTGDGYAMALRAGAELFNMEFMQQGIATTWPTQAMVMLYDMDEPYRLYNKHGKRFVQDYLPPGVTLEQVSKDKAKHWPVSCRDSAIHLDRAIHGEVFAGRATENDGVFLDISGTRRDFMPEAFYNHMISCGLDIDKDLLQVQFHHHTSNGGVRIDTDAQSPSVHGLFACGETAGWQGADRLGGTMLGGSQVFGWRAGAKAAEVAKNHSGKRASKSTIDRALGEPLARMNEARSAEGHDIRALKKDMQRVMWKHLLVERHADTLGEVRAFIGEERERLQKLAHASPFDLVLAIEHENMLDVAEVIVDAAEFRTESRGSHYRADYPERDDEEWLTNVFVTKPDDGRLHLEKRWVAEEEGFETKEVRISPWG